MPSAAIDHCKTTYHQSIEIMEISIKRRYMGTMATCLKPENRLLDCITQCCWNEVYSGVYLGDRNTFLLSILQEVQLQG